MKRYSVSYLLIVMLLAGTATSLSAQDAKGAVMDSNDLYYNIINYTKRYVEVTYPGDRLFRHWDDMEQPSGHIVFPATIMHDGKTYEVREIAPWTYKGCDGITGVDFPETLRSIGFSAFAECESITSLVIPASVERIGGCSFMGCRNLSSVTLSPNMTQVSDHLFADCSALQSIDLPPSLEYVGPSAFDKSGLVSVTLPATMKLIAGKAFSRCENLRRVEVLAVRPPVVVPDAFAGIAPDAVLYVPQGCREAYSAAEGWKLFSRIEEM